MDRVAFTVLGRDIYWYGVIIALGFLLGTLLGLKLAERSGVDQDDLLTAVLISTPVAILGARLYHVLTSLEHYHSLYDVLAIWEGGLAIYGGILAGGLCFVLCCRWKALPPLKCLDCAAPAVILGQAIGRWGNFFNQEAFGTVTDLPWRMELLIGGVKTAVHPTFLYESIWNFAGLLMLLALFKRRRFDGQVFWAYMGWYGFGRFFIEGLRVDSLYVGSFRISQVLGIALFALSVGVLLLGGRRVPKEKTETGPEGPKEETIGGDH
ncbi:MAG: prolipoprotein diacylglyceryl transferase [Clostridiales bacterium]|nr:prolipoprotein diacylglyceryl transferase [Clostridiales bacterium]